MWEGRARINCEARNHKRIKIEVFKFGLFTLAIFGAILTAILPLGWK